MKSQNYSTAFTVDQTPEEAFAAINNVRGWWSGNIEGNKKITESIHGKKIVWLVLDSHLNFIEDKTEWNGTKITFDIAKKGDKTEVRFTHMGLTPEVECYGACSNAWGGYINRSLRRLIAKGKGQPNPKEKADREKVSKKRPTVPKSKRSSIKTAHKIPS